MSVATRRKAPAGFFSLSRLRLPELSEVWLKRLYTVLMGVLLLEFLCRMATFSNNAYTPRPVMIGHAFTTVLGIWLGKTWKDKGFRLMIIYLLWMSLRCFISVRENPESSLALNRILALFWAVGGCYSVGRILSKKEIMRFLSVLCFIWTAGMVVSSSLGIAAAWMRIRIPNLNGAATWKMWGEASSARLNLIYCSTISGGILSLSILIALLAAVQKQRLMFRMFYFLATLPMTLALCLTDSRTAQISLSVGIASLFFILIYSRIRSCTFRIRNTSTGSPVMKPSRLLILLSGSILVGILSLFVLLHVNQVFDYIKTASTKLGIIPSGAAAEGSTVLMSHRGFHVEDVFTGRDLIWKAAAGFLSSHPRYLLYGASIVNPMSRIVDQGVLNFTTDHCHNIALQILVEGGLPAALAAIGFAGYIVGKAVRNFRNGNNPLWLIMIPCLMLSVLVGDMGECLLWLGFRSSPTPYFLFLLAGITASCDHTAIPAGSADRVKRIRSFLVFPVACAVLICSLAPFLLSYDVPVIRQDDYDDPEQDLYYTCGDENCETNHGMHTIKTSGCGLCAIANAVRYMTGQEIDIHDLAAFARNNEQYVVHAGSKSTVSKAAADEFGDIFGFSFIGEVASLQEATPFIRQGCTVIAGVGNNLGGGHLLVVADYDPLTKEYLILDSAGNYDGWSRSFSSWQRIADNHLRTNPYVFFTSFRILAPVRLSGLSDAL